jgi:hypothetical protein
MEIIFEFLAQLIIEFVLQLIGEALSELGLRAIRNPLTGSTDWSRILRLVLALALGVLLGLGSLWVFPHPLYRTRFYGIGMIVSPVLSGSFMAGVGKYLRYQNKELTMLDNFFYGFIFALAMSVTRYIYAA